MKHMGIGITFRNTSEPFPMCVMYRIIIMISILFEDGFQEIEMSDFPCFFCFLC